MTKKILVTGANGQLSKTIKELYENNDIGLDFVFVSKKDLDITESDKLKLFFDNKEFDYCINCAAYTNVEQAEKIPEAAFKVNAEGVKNLAEICAKSNTILIHISTDYVFDGEKKTPYQVGDDTNPINVYGKSKLLGEQYIQNIMTEYFILRTSWLYSKKYGNNFYKTIIDKGRTESQLSITTEQKGCPTDTVNLSKFLIHLIEANEYEFGILHYCDQEIMTWFEFAKEILLENNLSGNINLVKVDNYRTLARRPKFSVLENSN